MTLSQGALFLVAGVTHPNRLVPALGRDGALAGGASGAHPRPAGPAVMYRQLGAKLFLALVAGGDLVIRDPVGGACRVFYYLCNTSIPKPV